MIQSDDVMVIFAHPDDAEFGIGGTVARWTAEGRRVVYVACTSGDKGTSDPALPPDVLAETREQEQKTAARVLGVQDVMFLRHPDQGLEDTPEFRKIIVRAIRTFRPGAVVTLDPYRRYVWHRDHRIVGQVTLDALFPYARDHLAFPDLLEEGLAPHKVREALFWGSEEVNYCSDITSTFSLKVSALLCHESQVRDMTKDDLEERLRYRSRAMAEGEPFELGEAFYRISLPR